LGAPENEQPSKDFDAGRGAVAPDEGVVPEPLAAIGAERVQGRHLEGVVGVVAERERPAIQRVGQGLREQRNTRSRSLAR
jgi:hypothetical protein